MSEPNNSPIRRAWATDEPPALIPAANLIAIMGSENYVAIFPLLSCRVP